MNTAPATPPVTQSIQLSPAERELVRRMYDGAPEHEIDRFMHMAESLGMNPVHRQIYLRSYNDRDQGEVWQIVCGIDGYRAAAERTGLRAGLRSKAITEGGKWVGYEVTVLKRVPGRDIVDEYPANAFFEEYAAYGKYGLTRFWKEKPRLMTEKCAEALAYRRAFPFLSGTYTSDELDRTISAADAKGAPEIDKKFLEMSEHDVRKAFAEFIAGRDQAAKVAFKEILPQSGVVAEIPLAQIRLVLSAANAERYRKKLESEATRIEEAAKRAQAIEEANKKIQEMPEPEVRKAFSELVGNREHAAKAVFVKILPASGVLGEISLDQLRVVLSSPYRERYGRKLDAEVGRIQAAAKLAAVNQQQSSAANSAPPQAADAGSPMQSAASEATGTSTPALASEAQGAAPADSPERADAQTSESTQEANSIPPTAANSEASTPANVSSNTPAPASSEPPPTASHTSETTRSANAAIDPEIAKLAEPDVRKQFEELIAGRVDAAIGVFARILPVSGKLSEIPLDSMRTVLSKPYRDRYSRMLDRAAAAQAQVDY